MALRLLSEYRTTTRPALIKLGKITKIGRSYSNDAILCSTRQVPGTKGMVTPSSWISRSHAVIYKEPDGYFIEDCSSTGTYVNNTRLAKGKRVLLDDGVEIFFGMDSFKNRKPPKMGEKSKDISDFFFVFEKSAKPLKRKIVSQSFDRTPVQLSRKKFRRSPLQVLNSKGVKKVDMGFSHKCSIDNSNSETQTQVACDIENYETPLEIIPQTQPMKPQMRNNGKVLPYQQTIAALRDMLKIEREENSATVEHIQKTSRQREADLNSKLKRLEDDRKQTETELHDLRLEMAQQKAKTNAEITKFNEKVKQLQSELREKEKRNSGYMESIIDKLTTVHKKQIAEQAQRIRELEMSKSSPANKQIVVLQFGERSNPQTRRCWTSLDWTVERLCELVHRKYVKKIPGNQMEVVLHRTYTVMDQSKRLACFNIRKGELLVIRKRFVPVNPSNLTLRTEAFSESLHNDVHIKRHLSPMPRTPLNNKKINSQEDLQSVISSAKEHRQASYQKKLVHESRNLSPIMGESKIGSYRYKLIEPRNNTKLQILDDEKDPSKEPSVDIAATKMGMKLKSPKVFEQLEMEDLKDCRPSSKKKNLKRRKSLKNSKLKPKR